MSLIPFVTDDKLIPLLDSITEFQVCAVPQELQDSEVRRYYSVYVKRRGPGSWAVTDNFNSCYDMNLVEEYESLPSERTDEFLARFRFTLPQAIEIAERLAKTLKLYNAITVDDIIKHGSLTEAFEAYKKEKEEAKDGQ